jgi:hypothetical protein
MINEIYDLILIEEKILILIIYNMKDKCVWCKSKETVIEVYD